jgi:pyridoxamine 5'-phosphate oxidase
LHFKQQNMAGSIADIRKNYSKKKLSEEKVNKNPIKQFEKWWKEALGAKIVEPNAMTLATASAEALPSARIVLLKDLSEKGFVFFTNYDSYKGRQLAENPRACLVFFWKELERQVRITGLVNKLAAAESDAYFYSRPKGSRLGAITSPQSQVIDSREWLDEQYRLLKKKTKKEGIERPLHWGGYIVRPVVIEFWQGRPSRLHDRIQYSLEDDGEWRIERLAP